MIRVAVRDKSDHLRVDARVTCQRSRSVLQDHHAGTLGHDKAVSPPVIWTGCLLGFFIACAHRTKHAEGSKPAIADGRVTSPRQHTIGLPLPDSPEGLSDCIRPGRTPG